VPNGEPTLNAYNLDPMVWFVHEKLGLSGYGFSLDDDVAFVNGEYATKLDVAIGGLNGLQNKNEWSISAPFGPVHSQGTTTAGDNTTITGLDAALFDKLLAAGPANLGAQVNSTVQGLLPGTTVVTTSPITGAPPTTTVTITPGSTLPAGTNEYWFFGPVTATGTLTPGASAITDLDPVALATLSLVGPQTKLRVSGPGVQPDTMVLSIDGTTVYLSKSLKSTGVRVGTFAFTFT
jgi:hypothetical protein